MTAVAVVLLFRVATMTLSFWFSADVVAGVASRAPDLAWMTVLSSMTNVCVEPSLAVIVRLVELTLVTVPGRMSAVSGLLSLSAIWTRTPRKCWKRSAAGMSVSPASSGGRLLVCHPA